MSATTPGFASEAAPAEVAAEPSKNITNEKRPTSSRNNLIATFVLAGVAYLGRSNPALALGLGGLAVGTFACTIIDNKKLSSQIIYPSFMAGALMLIGSSAMHWVPSFWSSMTENNYIGSIEGGQKIADGCPLVKETKSIPLSHGGHLNAYVSHATYEKTLTTEVDAVKPASGSTGYTTTYTLDMTGFEATKHFWTGKYYLVPVRWNDFMAIGKNCRQPEPAPAG